MANYYPDSPPNFNDTAFEPDSGYMFDESGAIDQLRRELDAPYDGGSIMFDDDDQQAESAMMSWGRDTQGMSSNDHRQGFHPQELSQEGFPWNHNISNPSPAISWQTPAASMQQAHASASGNRDGGVAQHYGQVTPLTSQSQTPDSVVDDVQQKKLCQSQQTAQSNAKSERARNAANHRHAQAKEARETSRKSKKSMASRGDGKEEEEDKPRASDKQEYREKNRQAAAKCRRKKKDSTEILESSARAGKEENTQLKATIRALRDELSDYRTKALAHDGSAGCACVDIHRYNAEQARQAARGQGSMHDIQDMQTLQAMQSYHAMQAMQSPPEGQTTTPEMQQMSLGSMSRAQSFSMDMPSGMAMQHSRHARADSKQDNIISHATALQLGGNDFGFDPRLDEIQEEGTHGAYL